MRSRKGFGERSEAVFLLLGEMASFFIFYYLLLAQGSYIALQIPVLQNGQIVSRDDPTKIIPYYLVFGVSKYQ